MYGTLKVLVINHYRYNSIMRHYLKEVKFVRKPNKGFPGISGPANPARQPAPKSNHAARTLAPKPMPGWHLNVPSGTKINPCTLTSHA